MAELHRTQGDVPTRRDRVSRSLTVFAAALVAGGGVALGVNRLLELQLERSRPRVECEPIFIALRSLPPGSAVTVWDVGLRDWPKAMVPSAAVRSIDRFDGLVARHPLREGQPLLAAQLSFDPESRSADTPPQLTLSTAAGSSGDDLWLPAETAAVPVAPGAVVQAPAPTRVVPSSAPDTAARSSTAPPPPTVTGITPAASPVAAARPAEASASATVAPVATVTSAAADPPTTSPLPIASSPPSATPETAPVAAVDALPTSAPSTQTDGPQAGDVAPPIAAGGGLRPLLPEPWVPATLRTIVVPQRIAFKADGDTAAAVAAAVSAGPSRSTAQAAGTTSERSRTLRASAPVSPAPTAAAPTRIAAGRRSAGAPDATPGPAAPPGRATAPAPGRKPTPPSGRPRTPPPARGYRLPPFFDWSK